MARGPIANLIIYSFAMITLPIVAFFVSKAGFDAMGFEQGNIYGAACAVITVHIILFGFVYVAYEEDRNVARDKLKELSEKKD